MRSKPKKKTFLILLSIILAISLASFGYITIEKNQSKRLNNYLIFLNKSWEDKEKGYLKKDINEKKLEEINKELSFPKKTINIIFDKKGLMKKLNIDYRNVNDTITLQKDINNLFIENSFSGEGISINPVIKKDISTSDVVKVKDRVEYAKLNNKWNNSATILIKIAMQQAFWNEQVENNMNNLRDQKEIESDLFSETKEAISLIKNQEVRKEYESEIVQLEKDLSDGLILKTNNSKKSLEKSTKKNGKYYQEFDSNYQNKINEDDEVWNEKLTSELNKLENDFNKESSSIEKEKPIKSTNNSTTESTSNSGGFNITNETSNNKD